LRQDPWHDMVREALRDAPFAMRQLAAESGLSYDVLRSWRSGRRHPNKDSVRRLAEGLNGRAERLQQLSRELRDTVEKE
jgi:ribosome-binding protein aMBF1 (putative translation factor)